MRRINPVLLRAVRLLFGPRWSLLLIPIALMAGACRTVHEPTVEQEALPRAGVEALSPERSHPVPAETLAEVPMSSTGIVMLRPPGPKVPLDEGAMPGDEAAEDAGAEADVVLLREAWPNPVARGGLTAAPVGIRMEAVLFGYDSADLDFAARQAISRYAVWLKAHGDVQLTLEGHCDERGSSEYNYNLAMARAWTVKDQLIGLGVDERRLFTISYGEEQPIALGESAAAFALNRRVEFRPFYPTRDGNLLSTLREEGPGGSSAGDRSVPPPQPPLELGAEPTAWPPLEDDARP